MADLTKILISYIFLACYLVKHFYGIRVMFVMIVVFIGAFALTKLFIPELTELVCNEAQKDETIADEQAKRSKAPHRFKKQMAYNILSMSTNAFRKIVTFCANVLEDGEDDLDE